MPSEMNIRIARWFLLYYYDFLYSGILIEMTKPDSYINSDIYISLNDVIKTAKNYGILSHNI